MNSSQNENIQSQRLLESMLQLKSAFRFVLDDGQLQTALEMAPKVRVEYVLQSK